MSKPRTTFLLMAIVGALFAGCGDKEAEHADHDDHAGHAHGDGDHHGKKADADGDGDGAKAALQGLSAADQKRAREQAVCPVSDEPLGSMGTPIKSAAGEGDPVFLCCKGCLKAFEKSPQKYREKLKQ